MLLIEGGGLISPSDSRAVQAQRQPKVWVLLGKGTGGNAQMRALAEAVGWPYEAKQLYYNRYNRLSNLLLGASSISLNRTRSDPLSPPWPDLVIAASKEPRLLFSPE